MKWRNNKVLYGAFGLMIGLLCGTLLASWWIASGLSLRPWQRQIEPARNIFPAPVAISDFSADTPAGESCLLRWTAVPDAPMYELELDDELPEAGREEELSTHCVWSSRQVYANAYHADLAAFKTNVLYWRVRALDFHGQPLTVFSSARPIHINHSQQEVLKPHIEVEYNSGGRPTPLYPVYQWIPIPGAVSYEVELLQRQPEQSFGTDPSRYRIWSKVVNSEQCYDDEPRLDPGWYYWRVRGQDGQGNPVGIWSDVCQFLVDLNKGNYSASYGDSIVHGGGSVSYSPVDWEYDFQSYLKFPHINLGRSGDVPETMVKRFEHDVLPFHPRYLIILGGTNSLRNGDDPQQVIYWLSVLRDKCLFYNIRPIFLTLPPINPDAIYEVFQGETAVQWREGFRTVNEWIKRQQYYIDIAPQFTDSNQLLPEALAVDGLHPGQRGKRLMAKIINDHWAQVTR